LRSFGRAWKASPDLQCALSPVRSANTTKPLSKDKGFFVFNAPESATHFFASRNAGPLNPIRNAGPALRHYNEASPEMMGLFCMQISRDESPSVSWSRLEGQPRLAVRN
ncbi:hypothetical protein, partial [Photobacterium aphoticum]|uniref:hypothetical protein n=1 Tax=Photobacterium aphoticum TaxID=754436 RepID=UPI001969ED98